MDPSNSFESQASVHANQPEQRETITCMSCDSYNAAAEGNIDFFKAITNQSLDLLRTPNKNTILHIYITALDLESKSTLNAGSESTISPTINEGTESTTANFVKKILTICPSFLRQANAKSETPLHIAAGSESTSTLNAGSKSTTNFVKEILDKCPLLLQQANSKGETPLHIAARYGHSDIVEDLLKYCAQTLHDQDLEEGIEPVKEMLRMTNKEKDTALHEAVRYNQLEVVKLLISKDPDFSYFANDAGETPLYIAAERGFEDVLFEILDKCKSPMHEGPLGRTALHAAVLKHNSGMLGRILEKIDGISREVDNKGWTPLHLAAYFGHVDTVEKLLDKDREVAYLKDTKGRTPLLLVARCGWPSAMKVIVERCPDCSELVDNRGWNVLHFALKGPYPNGCLESFMDIIKEKTSLSNLLNEKNREGDTPLHFYSNSTSLQVQLLNRFINHPRVDKKAFNKQNLNTLKTVSVVKHSTYKEMSKLEEVICELPQRVITLKEDTTKQEGKDGDKGSGDEEDEGMISFLRNASEAHLVVAALITTVTFAACITMPGGFASSGERSHPGSTLLRKNVAFKAFVITDTISMVLSSSAVFIHLLMPFLFNKYYDEDHRAEVVSLAFYLILGAMITMVLAFVTGTYAVLMPSLDLAIANCIIGLTFFPIIFLVVRKLLKDGL